MMPHKGMLEQNKLTLKENFVLFSHSMIINSMYDMIWTLENGVYIVNGGQNFHKHLRHFHY